MYQGYGTKAAFDRRAQVAQALMGSSVARTPQNVGEGVSAVGRALFGMLATRANKREEAEKTAQAQASMAPIIAALQGGQSAPNVPNVPFDLGQIEQTIDAADPIASSAAAAGIDPDAWRKQIQVESGGRADAVSPAGARGVAQIMPATARDPGYGVPNIFQVAEQLGLSVPDQSDATKETLLNDPEVNAMFGALYQRAMLDQFGGDPTLAAAAYNAGPGAVQQAGGVPNFAETQKYVGMVQPALAGQPQTGSQPPAPQIGGQQGQNLVPMLLAAASNDWLPEGQRQIVNALLQRELATPEGVTAYQKAQLDLRRQELDARLSGRISDAPVVNVDARGPAPDKFAERTGTVLADEAAEVAKAGAAASANIRAIDRLEGLLSNAPTGGMAAFQQMLGEFGIETRGLSEIQAAQALINKLVPEQRAPGTGPMSDADLALFKQSMPRIINTPEGNRLIIETLRKIAEYDIERGKIARELQLGRMGYDAAIDAWGALTNPLEGFAAPEAQPSGRNATRLRYNPETDELEPVE